MIARATRTLGATIIVFLSMTLGATLALVYAWFLGPAPGTQSAQPLSAGNSVLVPPLRSDIPPVRVEAPLSGEGDATKAAVFNEREVIRLYERAGPAVVAISSTVGQRSGLGSGVIIDPKGIVLTNYHVVRNAAHIEVALSDRTRFTGEVLGADPQNDLAVVRLVDAPGDLPFLPLGNSDAVRPGALAIAIGNPAGLERSLTVGVISGLDRTLNDRDRPPLRNVLQTDAAINPGNSGGPLLNSQGAIIGINTAIEPITGQRGFGGIGFAVPAATAARYLDRMLAGETIRHPWLGISGSDVTPEVARERRLSVQEGALIATTMPDSPAQAAGLQEGDVLVSLGGQPLRSMEELGEAMDRAFRPGDTATLGLIRDGRQLELQVTFGAWPE
ncbi:MAG: S1C family serine protease, partial [Chloroflexota bacterium]